MQLRQTQIQTRKGSSTFAGLLFELMLSFKIQRKPQQGKTCLLHHLVQNMSLSTEAQQRRVAALLCVGCVLQGLSRVVEPLGFTSCGRGQGEV